MNHYLSHVHNEATLRGYSFNKDKIDWNFNRTILSVTTGQLTYEKTHLLNKLATRDAKKYKELVNEVKIELHPLFNLVEGSIEEWEIVRKN